MVDINTSKGSEGESLYGTPYLPSKASATFSRASALMGVNPEREVIGLKKLLREVK